MKSEVHTATDQPIVVEQPESDGRDAWLYDDSFTAQLLATPWVPSFRHAKGGSEGERLAAEDGQLLCIETGAEFVSCTVILGLPSDEVSRQHFLKDETTSGFLYLPTGRLRIDGATMLRIDPDVRECFGNQDPWTPVVVVEPGWYQIVVYREKSGEHEAPKTDPFLALVALPEEPPAKPRPVSVGYPVIKKKRAKKAKKGFREVVRRGYFEGKLMVSGDRYEMKIPPRGKKALGFDAGLGFTILSIRDPSQYILGVVTEGGPIESDNFSRHLSLLLENDGQLALLYPERAVFTVIGNSTKPPFHDGDHHVSVTPFPSFMLGGMDLSRIRLTAADDQPEFTIRDGIGTTGEAYSELLELVDPSVPCTLSLEASIPLLDFTDRVILSINLNGVPEGSTEADVQITISLVKGESEKVHQQQFDKWPKGLKHALFWAARKLRKKGINRIKVKVWNEHGESMQDGDLLERALSNMWLEFLCDQSSRSQT